MRIVVVGGAGHMGRIALRDLVESPSVEEIVIADLDLQRSRALVEQIGSPKLQATAVDATDTQALTTALRGAGACLNASVYYFNLPIMRACLAARTHYLDLYHAAAGQSTVSESHKNQKGVCATG